MWTNDYIRIPFKDHGRSREGADCWGLVRIVFEERLGIILPELIGYKDTHDREAIPDVIKNESLEWQSVEKDQEQEYDVLVFRLHGVPMHVGLVVSKGIMLHCERGSGTTVTNYETDLRWKRNLVGIYRHAERTDLSPTV